MTSPAEAYLEFKTQQIRAEWESGDIHPALRVIVMFAALLRYRLTGRKTTLTSLLRTGDPQSPHCARPCRGADLRSNDLAHLTASEWAAQIKYAVPYLGDYSTVLLHDVGQGDHLHLQVSPTEADPRKTDTPGGVK
jgi:hypothetical protein